MKKSLLALSILGAFAGVAQAQTNVTMYGVADAGFVRLDNGTGKISKLDSGVYSGSRLGFKGTEDLGGGLQGLFVLETGINIDAGGFPGGLAFGRQAYVGLGGNFGSVKLGRQQTFSYYAQAAIDPFGIGLAGDSTKFFGGATRLNNTVKFESANLSGLTFGASHSFGEQVPVGATSAESNGANNAVSVQYNNGPIFVQSFYEQSKALLPSNTVTKVFNAGGTYDFGVAKAHLMFDRVKTDGATLAGTNYRNALIGASIPFGASTFLVDYIKRTDKAANADAKQYAIGYTYAMSKRTTLYTSYSRVTNDSGIALGTVGTPSTTPLAPTNLNAVNGQAFKNFDVGVRHSF